MAKSTKAPLTFIDNTNIDNFSSIPAEIQNFINNPATPIIVAFSGGKDSVALVLRLLKLGVPAERIVLHHHDVDGEGRQLFDWACTISYCEAFAKAFNMKLVHSGRCGGILREIMRTNEFVQSTYYYNDDNEKVILKGSTSERFRNTKLMFPAVSPDLGKRWCSSVAKIDVLKAVINNTIESGQVLVLTGERKEESPKRAKYDEVEKHGSHTKTKKDGTITREVLQWRAVLDFSEKQVWDLFKEFGVQPHPCYMLGWGRCSCLTCIFSSDDTWASINQLAPDRVKFLSELEPTLGKNGEGHTIYTDEVKTRVQARDEDTNELMFWKNGNPQMRTITTYIQKPLMTKVEAGTSFIKPANLARWGKEATSVFTSPIFVKNWIMPEGAFGEESCGSL